MGYTVSTDGSVDVTEQVTANLLIGELRARRRFWRDEIQRLDADHAAQRANAVAERDKVVAMIQAVKAAGFKVPE